MTVLLIDLSAVAKKHWHTSSGDPDPDATATRTVAEVYQLAQGNPHVAICCDSGRSWRKDISADYKANRPERESAYDYQYQQAMDKLRADGFPVWAVNGFEADDIIATATKLHDGEVVIATADKDLLALVDDRVTAKSVRNGDILGPDEVFAKMGVYPPLLRDFLCLVGDTSDNIKGAPGIGPKTAAELLGKYGDLEGIYGRIDDLKPGVQKGLADLAPRLDVVRQLVTLRYDAPIDINDVLKEREAPKMEDDVAEPTMLDLVDAQIVPETGSHDSEKRSEPVTALAPVATTWEQGLEPRNITEAKELSKWVHDSRQFLGSFGNPQAVLTTILAGRELGLQAMASLRAIHIIEGKPTLSADLIRALVIKSGLAKYFRCTERTSGRATFETQRGDDPPMALTFTIQEAQAAGLVKPKSGWEKNPADMLVARASAKLARLVYPDVVHGVYTPEELEDR